MRITVIVTVGNFARAVKPLTDVLFKTRRYRIM